MLVLVAIHELSDAIVVVVQLQLRLPSSPPILNLEVIQQYTLDVPVLGQSHDAPANGNGVV